MFLSKIFFRPREMEGTITDGDGCTLKHITFEIFSLSSPVIASLFLNNFETSNFTDLNIYVLFTVYYFPTWHWY